MKTIYTLIYSFNGSYSTAHSTYTNSEEEAIQELKTLLGTRYSSITIEDIISSKLMTNRI